MSPAEEKIANALQPFGWTCEPEFWEQYYSDPWIFNLANAVERLYSEGQSLRRALSETQYELCELGESSHVE